MVINSLSKQKPLPDCFTFDAFVLRLPDGDKSKRATVRVKGLETLRPALVVDTIEEDAVRRAILPAVAEAKARGETDSKKLGAVADPLVAALWASGTGKVRMPMYEHVTANRDVVRFNVAECRFQVGTTWTTSYVRLAQPMYLANHAAVSVSTLNGEMAKEEGVFARVANCSLGLGKKDGEIYWNCKAVETGPFASLNELPPYERTRLEFDAQPVVAPDVAELLPFPPADWATVPLPTGLLFVNRDTTAAVNFERQYDTVPAVLPSAAAPAAEVFIVQRPNVELRVDTSDKKEPDAVKLTLALGIQQGALNFRTQELVLRETSLTTAGAVHPRTLYALLQTHPIPMQLFVSVNAAETAADSGNYGRPGPLTANDGVDAFVTFYVERAAFALREYLEQAGGIEVTSKSLLARYGSDTAVSPYIPEDFAAAVAERKITLGTGKSWTRPALVNPYAIQGEASGVIALDEYRSTQRIPFKDYRLFALPLMQLPDYDRETVRKMTPEQGDAFVLSHRRPESVIPKTELADLGSANAEHAPWLQPVADRNLAKKRVPIFLFFAVKREMPVVSPAHKVLVHREHPPARPEDAGKLPLTASALRSALLQAKFAPQTLPGAAAPVAAAATVSATPSVGTTAPPADVVMADAPAVVSLKREREDDVQPLAAATTGPVSVAALASQSVQQQQQQPDERPAKRARGEPSDSDE